MKRILIIAGLLLLTGTSHARSYKVKTGEVSFSVAAPMRQLNAVNRGMTGSLNQRTGAVFFNVPIAGFQFYNEFNPDHYDTALKLRFNGFYMESGAYPAATYTGSVTNLDSIDFERDGTYPVQTEGTLTIRGVSNKVKISGTAVVRGKQISISCTMRINTADYRIRMPQLIKNAFFQDVDIAVAGVLVPD